MLDMLARSPSALSEAADRGGPPAHFTTQKLSGGVVPTLGGALPRCWEDTRRVDDSRDGDLAERGQFEIPEE
jgi:hypothetical protein